MKRFFKFGDQDKQVYTIQTQLKGLGYDCAIDGRFGKGTKKRVIEFQLKSKLNADGVVGPKTWKELGLAYSQTPFVPACTPDSEEAIYEMFGDPLEPGYWQAYGGFCSTPPELNHVFPYTFAGENGFWCNKQMIIVFQKVYSGIVRTGLSDELKTFHGCYNVRKIRGGTKLSTHSWGISVDHNMYENMLGHSPRMNPGVVECFKKCGFVWGGDFSRKDGMHFQFAKNY